MTAPPDPAAVLAPGDRVIITGRVPWTGFTGKIIGPFGGQGLDWLIELEGDDLAGHRTAQAGRNLKRVTAP